MDTPANSFGGGWSEQQNAITPLGAVVILTLALTLLVLRRRYAIIPVAIMSCFVAGGQRLLLFGANFPFARFLLLVGFIRVLSRREYAGINWNLVDRLMTAWAIVGLLAYSVLWGTMAAFIWRLGNLFDVFGCYLLMRCWIRSLDDVNFIALVYSLLSIPLALFFLIEFRTGRNMFSAFGGVPEFTVVREGRLRCQGAFDHPLVAGCFWACLLPIMVARWWRPHASKIVICLSITCTFFIIAATASSTPIITAMAAAVGGVAFSLRRRLRLIRYSILFVVVGVQLSVGRVWGVLAHIDLAGGSTGLYRFLIVDSAISHFRDWWFIGEKTMRNWSWLVQLVGDVPNQLVLEGLRGGLLAVILYLAVFVVGFVRVGKARILVESNPAKLSMTWALGSALLAHLASFIGLAYFGQINLVFCINIASVALLKTAPNRGCSATRRGSSAISRIAQPR
jgi:hypothetical protein